MNVLIVGATGLIGASLRRMLMQRQHHVVAAQRSAPSDGGAWVAIDMAQARGDDWHRVLADVDVVVNCVGIFRERPGQTFKELHHLGPVRLFDACAARGIRRVVQVSALGADEAAETGYHLSKRAADTHLLSLPLNAVVAQPSLVFSLAGASSRALLTLASLPVVPLPAGGRQQIQPIAIDDLAAALVALVEDEPLLPARFGRRVAMVGPEPVSYGDYLQGLRAGLGLAPAKTVTLPSGLMRMAALLGDGLGKRWPKLLLDSESWKMLQRGNCGDASAITLLLGRSPRAVASFVEPACADAARYQALLGWLLPIARSSLALVWIVTAIVSVFVYPVDSSFDLLARTGVPEAWRPAALHGAAALDLLFGAAILFGPRRARWRPWLWRAQAGLIVFYTAVITWFLPEFWAHPYGPLLKNLPMLALIGIVAWLEPEHKQ
ncbi:MAG TPA: SDR family oxidoreductase [Ideonella sp.]|uniref:SDR family oxidoreductase n=1 Tax=Ideonella sp. TaxID=1929293 RepID=UPI002E368E54|nr:SDR family oxidoreductase [Ideonella sp.]HEX5683323.1 SDR family oxidoreductase [Ideonella sp.]